jgi:hypothetical protein
MPLGQELTDLFYATAPNTLNGHTEVQFFRELITAFTSLPNYAALEIHGNKSRVKYTPSNTYFTRPDPACELADVAIIAYSPQRQQARLLFIQNKVAPRNNCASFDRLSADLIQYELLHDRPVFQFARRDLAGTAVTLLSASPTDSVALYGIFYQNGNRVDMSAITANTMTTNASHRPGRHPKGTIEYIHHPFQSLHSHGTRDFTAARNLADFGDLLEILFIGRPITTQLKNQFLLILNQAFPNPTPQQQQQIDMFRNMALDNTRYDDRYDALIPAATDPRYFARSLVFLNVDRQD